jgi:hypothetical protein
MINHILETLPDTRLEPTGPSRRKKRGARPSGSTAAPFSRYLCDVIGRGHKAYRTLCHP